MTNAWDRLMIERLGGVTRHWIGWVPRKERL